MYTTTASTVLVAGTALLALASGAAAQITSNATCLATFAGLYNSKGQSPCLVAAYLGGACNGGQFNVAALPSDHFYNSPSGTQANECQCSTVYYSLIGACSACQNITTISWTSWIQNCQAVSVDSFPDSIPADTAVPGWAYENVTIEDTFDVTSALADHSPESTATSGASTLSNVPVGTGTAASTGQTSPSLATSSGGSSSHTGAIAGGVVGGVVAIALLALLTFFLCRRRRRNSGGAARTDGGVLAGQGSPLMDEKPYNSGMYSPPPTAHPYTPGAYDQPRLYDPNDPSTFPTSPGSPPPNSLGTQLTGQTYTSSYPHSSTGPSPGAPFAPAQQTGPQGAYRGVAEV